MALVETNTDVVVAAPVIDGRSRGTKISVIGKLKDVAPKKLETMEVGTGGDKIAFVKTQFRPSGQHYMERAIIRQRPR